MHTSNVFMVFQASVTILRVNFEKITLESISAYFLTLGEGLSRNFPKIPQNLRFLPLSESVSIPQRSGVIPLSHRKYQTKNYRHRASRNIKNYQNRPNNKKVRADWSKKSFSKTWILANARFQWKPYVNLASREKVQVSDGSFRVPKVQKKLIFPKIKFRTQKYTLWANFDENIKGIEAGFFFSKKNPLRDRPWYACCAKRHFRWPTVRK